MSIPIYVCKAERRDKHITPRLPAAPGNLATLVPGARGSAPPSVSAESLWERLRHESEITKPLPFSCVGEAHSSVPPPGAGALPRLRPAPLSFPERPARHAGCGGVLGTPQGTSRGRASALQHRLHGPRRTSLCSSPGWTAAPALKGETSSLLPPSDSWVSSRAQHPESGSRTPTPAPPEPARHPGTLLLFISPPLALFTPHWEPQRPSYTPHPQEHCHPLPACVSGP